MSPGVAPRAAWISLAVLLAAAPRVDAQLEPINQEGREISQRVAAFLEQVHLTHRALDDDAARRIFRNYFSDLDPMKLYFYAGDIERFRASELLIDDQIKSGEIQFAFDVYRLFLERLDERMVELERLFDAKHDFTVDEMVQIDRDDASWPQTPKEMNELWRKRVKLLLLQEIASAEERNATADGDSDNSEDGGNAEDAEETEDSENAEETEDSENAEETEVAESPADLEAEARDKLRRRYRDLARRLRQTDNRELLQIFLSSASMTWDPHTTYMSPTTLEDFRISMRLQLQGIGALLRPEDGRTVVERIVPGGAAALEGSLQAEDAILEAAEGEDGEFVDLYEMKLTDVVKRIRGKAGTTVRLLVEHPDKKRTVISIVRAEIKLTEQEAQSRVHNASLPNGETLRIGIIDLPSFYMDMAAASRGETEYKSSSRDVEKILAGFERDKVDAVVLDLRGNGGGSLTEAVDMTGLFIDRGPVVLVKGPRGQVERKDDKRPGMAWKGPLVVLTSKLSASASEIFAGAIQDYGRGLVVGDPSTHGKGTVQHLIELGMPTPRNLGALKLTVSQFYRPKGRSTQLLGVVPDILLPSLTAELAEGESGEYALPNDRIDGVEIEAVNKINPTLVESLAAKSKERIDKSDAFDKLQADIRRIVQIRERKEAPLERSRFMTEFRFQQQAADDSGAGPHDPLGDKTDPDGEEPETPYMNEVLAITTDYVGARS